MTQVPHHHPDHAFLMDYAAGSLSEPFALLVSTHLALCPECRADVARLDALGGALMDDLAPAEVSATTRAAVMGTVIEGPARGRAASATGTAARSAGPARQDSTILLPQPLRQYVGDMDQLSWRRLMPGVADYDLGIGGGRIDTRLLRVAPGRGVPQHTHAGAEGTIVLGGAFSDETGRYARGDLAIHHEDVDHRPVAESGEECICLMVMDAPLRLTGPIGRWFNRLFARDSGEQRAPCEAARRRGGDTTSSTDPRR